MNDNVQPTAEVVIAEPDIADPEAVLKLLTQFAQSVANVVNQFARLL